MLSYYKRRQIKKRVFRIGIILIIILLLISIRGCDHKSLEPLNEREQQRYIDSSPTINLKRTATGKIEKLSLEEYIVGVVAGEMPISFNKEALKAQAVVARTYTMSRISTDSGYVMCDDYRHCQAYKDLNTMKKDWGKNYQTNYDKIRAAVYDTAGIVITYNGDITSTPYFSTCGGSTASAKEVWGRDYPYLQSVKCKWDKEAPRYHGTVKAELDDLPYLLLDQGKPVFAGGSKNRTVPKITQYSESGRAMLVTYGNKTYKGTEIRSMLDLNSTKMEFKVRGNTLIIDTIGFGHGVGMCQHGANGMAAEGYNYKEILAHYYIDTKLERYNN